MEKILFEIGTEELPANYMPNIIKELQALALKKLEDARIPHTEVKVWGTPRLACGRGGRNSGRQYGRI